MPLSWLLERFAEHRDQDAVVWQDRVTTYGELLDVVEQASRSSAANR